MPQKSNNFCSEHRFNANNVATSQHCMKFISTFDNQTKSMAFLLTHPSISSVLRLSLMEPSSEETRIFDLSPSSEKFAMILSSALAIVDGIDVLRRNRRNNLFAGQFFNY